MRAWTGYAPSGLSQLVVAAYRRVPVGAFLPSLRFGLSTNQFRKPTEPDSSQGAVDRHCCRIALIGTFAVMA